EFGMGATLAPPTPLLNLMNDFPRIAPLEKASLGPTSRCVPPYRLLRFVTLGCQNGHTLRRRLWSYANTCRGLVAVDTHRTVDDNANTLFERRKAVVGQRPQMPTEPLLSSGPDNQSEQRLRTFV